MVESSSSIKDFNPYHLNWETQGNLQISTSGIDLLVQTTQAPFIYEDNCFKFLLKHLNSDQFAIGPHLVDYLFGRFSQWQYEVRPDSFIFSTNQAHWELETIAEFKMTNSLHYSKKTERSLQVNGQMQSRTKLSS